METSAASYNSIYVDAMHVLSVRNTAAGNFLKTDQDANKIMDKGWVDTQGAEDPLN